MQLHLPSTLRIAELEEYVIPPLFARQTKVPASMTVTVVMDNWLVKFIPVANDETE